MYSHSSIWTTGWIVGLLALGCGSQSPGTADAPKAKDAPNNTSVDATTSACTTYTKSSVAAMRMGTISGCFEIDNVVSIGTTPSTKSPQLVVQDSGGGDYSAMLTRCSSTSTTHPCSVAATVAGIADATDVSIKGTYIKSSGTGFEEFFIDSITNNGSGVAPAPATATLAQIERGSTAHNLAFQRVTLSIATANALVMYDWTPAEFANASATACPYQFGFGMIPPSAGATAGAACSNGTTQPTGQATPNAAEILIGTDFYSGFTVSSDCRCAKTFTDTEPAATSKLSGTIGGVLVYDVAYGATTGYFYLDPKTASDAPITNTVAGM